MTPMTPTDTGMYEGKQELSILHNEKDREGRNPPLL